MRKGPSNAVNNLKEIERGCLVKGKHLQMVILEEQMWLAFIDETSDAKFKNYFGISLALVNSSFYPGLKRDAQELLMNKGWDPKIEFKGSCLFSATKGCPDVNVENRIELASNLLNLNVANKNRRMKFYFVKMDSPDQKRDYLRILPLLLKKALPRSERKGDKDLVCVACDYRSDIQAFEIQSVIEPVITEKNYVLFEQVFTPTSSFQTIGLLYADIAGYLVARIDNISRDSELFDNIPNELFTENAKIRKLQSSKDLISKIKRLSLFEVKR